MYMYLQKEISKKLWELFVGISSPTDQIADPLLTCVIGTDKRIRIRTKMSRIHSTALKL